MIPSDLNLSTYNFVEPESGSIWTPCKFILEIFMVTLEIFIFILEVFMVRLEIFIFTLEVFIVTLEIMLHYSKILSIQRGESRYLMLALEIFVVPSH